LEETESPVALFLWTEPADQRNRGGCVGKGGKKNVDGHGRATQGRVLSRGRKRVPHRTFRGHFCASPRKSQRNIPPRRKDGGRRKNVQVYRTEGEFKRTVRQEQPSEKKVVRYRCERKGNRARQSAKKGRKGLSPILRKGEYESVRVKCREGRK